MQSGQTEQAINICNSDRASVIWPGRRYIQSPKQCPANRTTLTRKSRPDIKPLALAASYFDFKFEGLTNFMIYRFQKNIFRFFKLKFYFYFSRCIMERYLLIVLTVCLISCQQNKKFDKEKWAELGDLGTYPNRQSMLDDLISSHKLVGRSFSETIDLLGEPVFSNGQANTFHYDIDVDYGYDIDPIYVKTMSFQFNIDSIITSYRVNEWRK
jgi:hypothetical protein